MTIDVTTPSLTELIQDFQQEDGSDFAKTARRVLEAVLAMPELAQEMLFPVVYNQVRASYRNDSRQLERRTGGPISDPTKKIRDILTNATFVNPEHGYVDLGLMTLEQHMAREAYLEAQAAGTRITARFHGDIARALRRGDYRNLRGLRKADPSLFAKLMEGGKL